MKDKSKRYLRQRDEQWLSQNPDKVTPLVSQRIFEELGPKAFSDVAIIRMREIIQSQEEANDNSQG